MKKNILVGLLIILINLNTGFGQTWMDKAGRRADTIICYGSNEVHKSFIPPPTEFLLKSGDPKSKTAEIIVNYKGFSPLAQAAFEYAVSIWETLIVSSVPIHLEANWTNLGDEGTLGNCGAGAYYLGLYTGGLNPNAYYPVALAEKMLGSELTGADNPDLIANFNSIANWYLGTDGATGTSQYDLVSVVLHEITHGLGFIGTMDIESGNLGTYGFDNGFTIIFDHFLEVEVDEKLTDTSFFSVPSASLGNALTGDDLFFSGPVELDNNYNFRAKLYAPDTFDPGSSVYHLDESQYSPGNAHSLMTPFISRGEAIHHPGKITLGMMADWGWIHTFIDHEPLIDREDLSSPVLIQIVISSDTGYYSDSTYLVYSYDEFETDDTIVFNPAGKGDQFEAIIPVDIPDRTISYYISTQDDYGRIYTNPPGGPDFYHQFYIGPDTVNPEIEHFPIEFMLYNNDSLKIKAAVTDNIGIDSVHIEYLLNDIVQDPLRMNHDTLDDYLTYIIVEPGILNPGDSISYRIVAVDSSQNTNSSVKPEEDFYIVRIEDIQDAQDEYQNDFNQASVDFLLTGFSITTPDGFSDGGLHSTHPYESPDQDNQTIEYLAQLKIPIILKESDSYMRFDEIALIEPGTAGTSWGDEEFWDYVVVEGSKDEGQSWHEFADGYDCRKYSAWSSLYNSEIVENSSTAVGTPSNYKSSMVNLLGSSWFSGGDTVLIRFRLFSDPYAHGWGWAIDNLEIQGSVSQVEENPLQNSSIRVYPNPTQGVLHIQLMDLPESVQEIKISVLDILGREVRSLEVKTTQVLNETIDIYDLPDGIYLVKFQAGKFHRLHKILKAK